MWEVQKLWRYGVEAITGVGDLAAITAMRDWYMDGADPDKFRLVNERSSLIVVGPRGLIKFDASPHPVEYHRYRCAFGTGRAYAMGAMAMGATAREAALVASEFDPSSSSRLDEFQPTEEETTNG
jgi:hypothetical protein